MTWGLNIFNETAGRLIMDHDGFALSYLGKPAITATNAHTITGTSGTPGFFSQIGGYTVSIAGDASMTPILYVKPLSGYYVWAGVPYSSGGVWNWAVRSVDNSGTDGFGTLTAPECWAFARPTSLLETWGMAIYDSAGVLAADLTRRPMVVRGVMQFPAIAMSSTRTDYSVALPASLTKTAVCASPNGFGSFLPFLAGNEVQYEAFWTLSGSDLVRTLQPTQYEYFAGTSPAPAVHEYKYYKTTSFQIEGAILP